MRMRFNAKDYGSFEASMPSEHFEAIRAKAFQVIGAGANSGDRTRQATVMAPLRQSMPPPTPGQPAASPPSELQAPAPVSRPAMPPTALPKSGVDSYTAERVARQSGCNSTALATLVAKGPGYENYSMQCTSGDMMMLRCEMGNCRVLK